MTTPNNLQELRALQQTGAPLNFRFFLDYQPSANRQITNACLSQWWPCIFTVDGAVFTTAEHFMMYQKALLFGDHDTALRILDSDHPFEAKTLGRSVRGFNEGRWDEARFEIVIRGNIEKFVQNKNLLNFLLATGDDILAEASPNDLVWGIGSREEDPTATRPQNWPGQNLLGFALMRARERLRPKSEPEQAHLISDVSH
jgi:ribA/ribD-fused uncharacterized protein